MNIVQMGISASILIVAIIIIRALALYRLPKTLFTILWSVAALRLLLPFSLSLTVNIPRAAQLAENIAYYTYMPVGGAAVSGSGSDIIQILSALWLIGVYVCALWFVIAYFKFRREFAASLPTENTFITQWLSEHRLRRRIDVRVSDRIAVPLTYGVFRPVILLPKNIDWDNKNELLSILMHEHYHIRYFDALFKLVFAASLCVHWFNLFVWGMYILANRDLELRCDESVILELGTASRSDYAMTLINFVEMKSGARFLPASYFSKSASEERIRSIMKTKKYTVPIIIIATIIALCSVSVFAAPAPADEMSGSDNTNISAVAALPDYASEANGDASYPSGDEQQLINSKLSQLSELLAEFDNIASAEAKYHTGNNRDEVAISVNVEDGIMPPREQLSAMMKLASDMFEDAAVRMVVRGAETQENGAVDEQDITGTAEAVPEFAG